MNVNLVWTIYTVSVALMLSITMREYVLRKAVAKCFAQESV
ncbi:hypothetical protein [Phyllobacterium sp. 628]|nr:hypothetical protein [Phyllobacterium sp. 628]